MRCWKRKSHSYIFTFVQFIFVLIIFSKPQYSVCHVIVGNEIGNLWYKNIVNFSSSSHWFSFTLRKPSSSIAGIPNLSLLSFYSTRQSSLVSSMTSTSKLTRRPWKRRRWNEHFYISRVSIHLAITLQFMVELNHGE